MTISVLRNWWHSGEGVLLLWRNNLHSTCRPPPPHDLCIVNREYCVHRKPDSTVHVTNGHHNCHDHLNPRCVKMKHGDFITSMLNAPHML